MVRGEVTGFKTSYTAFTQQISFAVKADLKMIVIIVWVKM